MASMFGLSRRNLWTEFQQLRTELHQLRHYVLAEVQHLEAQVAPVSDEVAAMRLQRFLKAMHQVVHLQVQAELPAAKAIAAGLQSVMKPLPYGVAGGRARARYAPRYDDGTFMSYDDAEEIDRQAYERMASGGRARARGARRAPDGTFL